MSQVTLGPPRVLDGPVPVPPRYSLLVNATIIDDLDYHWMAGGAVFAVILVVSIVLRIGLRLAAVDVNHSGTVTTNGFLVDASTDLLFLSMGMWLTRAAMVYQRWRQHQNSLTGLAGAE